MNNILFVCNGNRRTWSIKSPVFQALRKAKVAVKESIDEWHKLKATDSRKKVLVIGAVFIQSI